MTTASDVSQATDDTYSLYDLRIQVVLRKDAELVCKHVVGDYIDVKGEMLYFPGNQPFSMYALAALLPHLAARQRMLHKNDWMSTDDNIACPDPNCGAMFRIFRTAIRTESHGEATVVPLR